MQHRQHKLLFSLLLTLSVLESERIITLEHIRFLLTGSLGFDAVKPHPLAERRGRTGADRTTTPDLLDPSSEARSDSASSDHDGKDVAKGVTPSSTTPAPLNTGGSFKKPPIRHGSTDATQSSFGVHGGAGAGAGAGARSVRSTTDDAFSVDDEFELNDDDFDESNANWLSDRAWQDVVALAQLEGLEGLDDFLSAHLRDFRSVIESADPVTELLNVLNPDTAGFNGELEDDKARRSQMQQTLVSVSVGTSDGGETVLQRQRPRDDLLARMAPSGVDKTHRVMLQSSPVRGVTSPGGQQHTSGASFFNGVQGGGGGGGPGSVFGHGSVVLTPAPPGQGGQGGQGGLPRGASFRKHGKTSVAGGSVAGPPLAMGVPGGKHKGRRGSRATLLLTPTGEEMPGSHKFKHANVFQHLLILRCLRPDCFVAAAQVLCVHPARDTPVARCFATSHAQSRLNVLPCPVVTAAVVTAAVVTTAATVVCGHHAWSSLR